MALPNQAQQGGGGIAQPEPQQQPNHGAVDGGGNQFPPAQLNDGGGGGGGVQPNQLLGMGQQHGNGNIAHQPILQHMANPLAAAAAAQLVHGNQTAAQQHVPAQLLAPAAGHMGHQYVAIPAVDHQGNQANQQYLPAYPMPQQYGGNNPVAGQQIQGNPAFQQQQHIPAFPLPAAAAGGQLGQQYYGNQPYQQQQYNPAWAHAAAGQWGQQYFGNAGPQIQGNQAFQHNPQMGQQGGNNPAVVGMGHQIQQPQQQMPAGQNMQGQQQQQAALNPQGNQQAGLNQQIAGGGQMNQQQQQPNPPQNNAMAAAAAENGQMIQLMPPTIDPTTNWTSEGSLAQPFADGSPFTALQGLVLQCRRAPTQSRQYDRADVLVRTGAHKIMLLFGYGVVAAGNLQDLRIGGTYTFERLTTKLEKEPWNPGLWGGHYPFSLRFSPNSFYYNAGMFQQQQQQQQQYMPQHAPQQNYMPPPPAQQQNYIPPPAQPQNYMPPPVPQHYFMPPPAPQQWIPVLGQAQGIAQQPAINNPPPPPQNQVEAQLAVAAAAEPNPNDAIPPAPQNAPPPQQNAPLPVEEQNVNIPPPPPPEDGAPAQPQEEEVDVVTISDDEGMPTGANPQPARQNPQATPQNRRRQRTESEKERRRETDRLRRERQRQVTPTNRTTPPARQPQRRQSPPLPRRLLQSPYMRAADAALNVIRDFEAGTSAASTPSTSSSNNSRRRRQQRSTSPPPREIPPPNWRIRAPPAPLPRHFADDEMPPESPLRAAELMAASTSADQLEDMGPHTIEYRITRRDRATLLRRAHYLPADYKNELEEEEEEEDGGGEKKKREDTRIKCTFCTDPLAPHDRVLSGECCDALFHVDCIQPYENSKCPCCRQNLLNSMAPNLPKED